MDFDANVGKWLDVVRRALTNPNKVRDLVLLKDWDVGRERLVGGAVEDKEVERPHLDGADAESGHVGWLFKGRMETKEM